VGYGEKWLLAYKSSNITEMQPSRTEVTIEDLWSIYDTFPGLS